MKNSLISVGLVTLFAVGLSACQGTSSDSASTNNSADGTIGMQKIHLDQASLEQISPHKRECKGANKDSKVCVEVCHRPPGNPNKGKSKVLPLSAVAAHLCHGENGHHHETDYVGPCHSEDDDSGDDGSSDDSSHDNGSSDDSSSDDGDVTPPPAGGGETGGGGTATGEIPAWCVPYIAVDANCDGVIDATGDPLL